MSRYGKFLPLVFSAFPLAFLLGELFRHPENTSSWLGLRIVASKLLLSGKELYVDFWDWSQPAAIAVVGVALRIRDGLESILALVASGSGGLSPSFKFLFLPEVFVPLCFFFVALLSFVLTARLFCYSSEMTKAHRAPLLLSFCLTLLICRFDFGDLQSLLLAGILPWLVVRVNSAQGVNTPRLLALLAGLLAGVAACLEAWYLLFFVGLEVVLQILERRPRSIVSVENGSLIAAVLAYLGFLLQLPAVQYDIFWKATMPLRFLQCTTAFSEIYGPSSSPHRLDVLSSAALAMVFPFLSRSRETLPLLCGALSLFGLVDYVWQNDGLSHGLVLTIFGSVSLVLLYGFKFLSELMERTASFSWPRHTTVILLGALSFAGSMLVGQALQLDRQGLDSVAMTAKEKKLTTVEESIEKFSQRGQKVAIVSDAPQPAYPLLLTYDRQPAFYTLNFSPYRLLADPATRSGNKYLSEFYQRIRVDFALVVGVAEASTVLIAKNFEGYLMAPALTDAFSQNYKTKDGAVYLSADNRQPHEFVGLNWEFSVYESNKSK